MQQAQDSPKKFSPMFQKVPFHQIFLPQKFFTIRYIDFIFIFISLVKDKVNTGGQAYRCTTCMNKNTY